MEQYVIPRNIKIRETVAYGLSGKQILYLTVGLGSSIAIWSITGIPLVGVPEKIAGSILTVAGSLSLSLAKRHGQELDKYLWNSIKYPIRAKEFEGGISYGDSSAKKPFVVTIRYNIP